MPPWGLHGSLREFSFRIHLWPEAIRGAKVDEENSTGDDPSKPKWIISYAKEFKDHLTQLTSANPVLAKAFEKRIRAVIDNPKVMGKRGKIPSNSRHIRVMGKWVFFWRFEGNDLLFLDCGLHEKFFRN